MDAFDVVVIGAGAAGMMCAAVAGQRGKKVVLVEHAKSPGEKIRISGGGRCNFTNRDVGHENFISDNPRFCRSALAGYKSSDFMALLRRHGIAFHEKHRGQLFCDGSAMHVVGMLLAECAAGGVDLRTGCVVKAIRAAGDVFAVDTGAGELRARAVVIATGGLSIPKMGASDFGYRIARKFGITVVEPRPGLVPLVFDGQTWLPFSALSGISIEATITCEGPYGRARFHEDLLLTHRGLSGPAALQISSHWRPGLGVSVNLTPTLDWEGVLAAKAATHGTAAALVANWLPRRLADLWVQRVLPGGGVSRPVSDLPDHTLRTLGSSLSDWQVAPTDTEGFRKAEVTVGGVDTRSLSSQTMEARSVRGLYFIGEVVDVTGWLGGYNFQWAWASAVACARAL